MQKKFLKKIPFSVYFAPKQVSESEFFGGWVGPG